MPRVKLVLEENQVVVLQGNPKVHNYIDRCTRFRARDFERTDTFKEGKWDGYTRLYDFNTHTFPIGLLDNVEMMLDLKSVDYDVIDNRVFRRFKKIPIHTNVQLRDYQLAAVERAMEKKRCTIQLPTGAGKTLVGVYITKKLGIPTVFYVHKKELLYQTARTYREHLYFAQCSHCPAKRKKRSGKCENKSCPVGIVGDGVLNIQPITIAMIQSADRLPKRLFRDFGIAIADECHHLPASTFFDIAKDTMSEYIIGLSATVRREDGKEMMIYAGAGPISYNISTSDLIRRGYLAKPHIHAISITPVMFGYRDNYGMVYDRAVTYNTERNEKIALKAVELSDFGPVYIHVRLIEHGEVLTNMINRRLLASGLTKAVFIHGSDKSSYRNAILDKFRRNEQPILVSTLLGEGVDLPNMYALILAAGGKSSIAIRQVFGRLLRISEHRVVMFYDVADKCKYLYDHFLERVEFYQSEEEFVLEEYIRNINTGR